MKEAWISFAFAALGLAGGSDRSVRRSHKEGVDAGEDHRAPVRYPESVDPVATDGRDIDTSIATLTARPRNRSRTRGSAAADDSLPEPWDRVPSSGRAGSPTYYDRPLLKKSVWSIDIPLYYFLGGAAGAALALGARCNSSDRGRRQRAAAASPGVPLDRYHRVDNRRGAS